MFQSEERLNLHVLDSMLLWLELWVEVELLDLPEELQQDSRHRYQFQIVLSLCWCLEIMYVEITIDLLLVSTTVIKRSYF